MTCGLLIFVHGTVRLLQLWCDRSELRKKVQRHEKRKRTLGSTKALLNLTGSYFGFAVVTYDFGELLVVRKRRHARCYARKIISFFFVVD